MKKYSICLIVFVIARLCPIFSQEPALFKIVERGRTGYMNNKGAIIIDPVFRSGSGFAEGLAAVRANGLYGFIDSSGRFVINPQYDYARDFQEGLACVFRKGRPCLIDRNNKVVLDTIFRSIQPCNGQIAIVVAMGGRRGVWDIKSRKLLVDTICSEIKPFRNGVAVMTALFKGKGEDERQQYAVIDTAGKVIVPWKIYNEILDFSDGCAIARILKQRGESMDIVIDTKGNRLFERAHTEQSYIEGGFHNGVALVKLYKYWLPESKDKYDYSKVYEGFIDLKGKLVFNDSSAKGLDLFSNGRIFVRDKENYRLLNREFQPVGEELFNSVQNNGFRNYYAIVKKDGKWGIVDTNGYFVVKPEYESIEEDYGVMDSVFFFGIHEGDEKRYGMADLKGNKLLEPMIQQFDVGGFRNGLLKAWVNNRLSYIDRHGNIVWQEKQLPHSSLQEINIDWMNRGYFYAFSRPHKDDPGGFGESRNGQQTVTAIGNVPPNKLSVIVRTEITDTLEESYKAFPVYIVNTTKDEVDFGAQDSRLNMKVQARNPDGIWKDIEYLPSSWCGNSYHTLTLDSGYFWKFTTPAYQGSFPTRLRIELTYIDPGNKGKEHDEGKTLVMYSNEYDGSVNPAQFWRKNVYYPAGFMDPYND